MTRKTLLLFAFIFIYISAESQIRDVISVKSVVVDDANLNKDQKNTVHITNISVLRSDSKSFVPQEKQAIVNSVSDNTSMKKPQTQISLSATLLTSKQVLESKTIRKQAIVGDKSPPKSDKKRVTIINLSATKIEN